MYKIQILCINRILDQKSNFQLQGLSLVHLIVYEYQQAIPKDLQ